MDKLEQYLDQVCRSVGGTRSMRQHMRQELREHLMDAIAQRKAAGATDEEALDAALREFGTPEEVRSGLEATHGHRLTAVLIDKAIQWQEKTMRAKWLWLTWVHLALVLVVAFEVLFITYTVMFIVPKFKKLLRDGILDPAILDEHGINWMPSFLSSLAEFTGGYTTPLACFTLLAWGLFEWRIRSENKSLMRLSALGTVAVVLMIVVWLASASLVICFCLGIPATSKVVREYALDQVATVDASVIALNQAKAKHDWVAMQDHATRASTALDHLREAPTAIYALRSGNEPTTVEELHASIKAARVHLGEAQQAIREKNAAKLGVAMEKFRKAYEPLSAAAKRSTK